MNEFQTTLSRLLDMSGKSVSQVAALGGVDRAYLTRLLRGEKSHPSIETLFRVWIGLCLDAEIVRHHPTFQHGLAELLLACAMSNASLSVMEQK